MRPLTAAELDFELRCRADYERRTGHHLDVEDYDPVAADASIKRIQQEMFIEKITERDPARRAVLLAEVRDADKDSS